MRKGRSSLAIWNQVLLAVADGPVLRVRVKKGPQRAVDGRVDKHINHNPLFKALLGAGESLLNQSLSKPSFSCPLNCTYPSGSLCLICPPGATLNGPTALFTRHVPCGQLHLGVTFKLFKTVRVSLVLN